MVDLVLMVDVYHELSQPQLMLRHIKASLKPGGRLVLLEYRKEDPNIPIRPEHKMSVAEAKMEVEAVYDNSDKNPRNPFNPPRRITLGEQTTNEMCFVFLGGYSGTGRILPLTPLDPKKEKAAAE